MNKTFVAKDLFDIQGKVTGLGNPYWKQTHNPSDKNADVVEHLLRAGAVLVGKSLTDEFAISLDGLNNNFPVPLNSQYPDRIPGGSSSGSASSVAAEACDFALGTDTVGSTRVPAAYCGIWGFRPSHGEVPLNGVHPLGPSFDTVGWLSKDPELILKIGETLLKPDCKSKIDFLPLIAKPLFKLVNETYQDELFTCAKNVARDIGTYKEITFDTKLLDIWSLTFSIIRSYEAWSTYGAWLEENSSQVSPITYARLAEGKNTTDKDRDEALRIKEIATKFLNDLLNKRNILCLPTTWNIPPLLNAETDELAHNRIQNIRLSIIAVIAGLPQVCFPVILKNGLCLSMSLVGPKYSDIDLIKTALSVKQHSTLG